MKSTTLSLGLSLFFFLAFTTAMHSQQDGKGKKSKIQKEFQGFDQDEDGVITLAEFKEKRVKKRKDKLSESELAAFYVRVEKNFTLYDKDEDGQVTMEEFKRRKAKVAEKEKKKAGGQ
ncbi:MAG: EF-hand domain-containing protein [Flavobacteriaceae bacterium]|nr:EF-hand domain-containing protein [Flavobacteriaceae bacterium]